MKINQLKKLGITLKNNWRVAVVTTVMMAICGYVFALYGMTKHYMTYTDIYIESTDSTRSDEKAATAALLFTSPKMYDSINDMLRTKLSYAELDRMIDVTANKDTQIISASFDCETSADSYRLSEVFLSRVQTVLDDYGANASIRIISYPAEPRRPEFPDENLFAMIGAGLGAVISVTGLIVIWRLDNTITAADNITEQYNVPVIGELMDFDNEIDYLGR
ncbi:MAG: hypothetical protein J6X60_13640, partial [Ruminiclostridium sp.]|nr:hypothetical protein [Ruminiclostridium sp.]